mgnify:CR=1 FL=1
MAKGEVVVTAQQVKTRKKTEKIVLITLLLLLLFLYNMLYLSPYLIFPFFYNFI